MPDSILRRARIARKLTPVQLAELVGVDQATVASWEDGTTPLPAEKASLLTAMLGIPVGDTARPNGLVEPTSPPRAEEEEAHSADYFGEVAIHFRSGGRPLMVSIDEAARTRIYAQFDERCATVLAFETLDNREVYVRKSAISDLHFSGDDVSAFGPEHGRYGAPVRGIASTDNRELTDPATRNGRDPVDAFAGRPVFLSSEVWRAIGKSPFRDGIAPEVCDAVDSALGSNDSCSYQLLATHMFWQVEGARRRGMFCSEGDALISSVHLLDLGIVIDDELLHLVCGDAGGYHHSVLVNFSALEYLTVPAHLLEGAYRADETRQGAGD